MAVVLHKRGRTAVPIYAILLRGFGLYSVDPGTCAPASPNSGLSKDDKALPGNAEALSASPGRFEGVEASSAGNGTLSMDNSSRRDPF